MQINVLEYLEKTVKKYPHKIAYANDEEYLTFQQVYDYSRAIGSYIAENNEYHNQPIVVYMDKHPNAISAFYGVVYSGNFYVPIDEEMPQYRIELIFQTLNPKIIICDKSTQEKMKSIYHEGKIYLFSDLIKKSINQRKLQYIRNKSIDIDPLYVVFTSGSTGIPKGVIASHRNVIDYIENLSNILQINENSIFGNQAPLYFDACLKELYPTLKFGATAYLIPKSLFMFPIQLIEFLNKYKINTICWVASALSLVSGLKTFHKIKPKYLHTIAFGNEIFPIKQYNEWRKVLPNARFINLYGPTEATGMSCYYEVNRDFELDEVIPIGRPFGNKEIFLLKEDNTLTENDEVGEICIRGTSITLGYYNNKEKTDEVFIQNPLNSCYRDIIYKTGDLAKYNDKGEIVFVSRKDYQIKHMGHRIELGEIELNVNMIEGITTSGCIYDQDTEKIVLYYIGEKKAPEVKKYLKEKLPRYMIPNIIKKLEKMPLTENGKIDRNTLKKIYKEKRRK